MIGLNREKLETRLKAVKLCAVAQFATARNNEHHDRQWGLPQAPNPNKEVGVLYNMGEHEFPDKHYTFFNLWKFRN